MCVIVALSCLEQSKIGAVDVVRWIGKVEDSIARRDVDRDRDVLTDSGIADGDKSCKSCSYRRSSHSDSRLKRR